MIIQDYVLKFLTPFEPISCPSAICLSKQEGIKETIDESLNLISSELTIVGYDMVGHESNSPLSVFTVFVNYCKSMSI